MGGALLVFRLRGIVLVAIALGAIQIARELLVVDFQFMQRVDFLGVVLAGKNLTSLDGLPLAAAEVDHPAPLQRHDLGPALGLYRSGSIDSLRNRAEDRHSRGHSRRLKKVGVFQIGSANGCNGKHGEHRSRPDKFARGHRLLLNSQKPNRLRSPEGTRSMIASISFFLMLGLRGPGALSESADVLAVVAGEGLAAADDEGCGWLSRVRLSAGTSVLMSALISVLAVVVTARQRPASALA